VNRRDFLKTIGAGLLAAAAPGIVLAGREIAVPSTKTIIDLNPYALPVEHAQWMGELRMFDLYSTNRTSLYLEQMRQMAEQGYLSREFYASEVERLLSLPAPKRYPVVPGSVLVKYLPGNVPTYRFLLDTPTGQVLSFSYDDPAPEQRIWGAHQAWNTRTITLDGVNPKSPSRKL
jgi:hypothetical protein